VIEDSGVADLAWILQRKERGEIVWRTERGGHLSPGGDRWLMRNILLPLLLLELLLGNNKELLFSWFFMVKTSTSPRQVSP